MNALLKLWVLKGKGVIRNLFRKPTSAIFTILLILFYGGLFLMSITMDVEGLVSNRFSAHLSIMIAIGFCAMMIMLVMMQKKKALFLETDSFYMFSGPFTRNEVMRYLSMQSIFQSIMFGALSLFIMACYTIGTRFHFMMYIMIFVVCSCIVYFFLLLTDYLYILSITNESYKRLSFFIALVFIVIALLIFVYSCIQCDMEISSALIHYVLTDTFYYIPIFGWGKLVLISFHEANYLMSAFGFILLIGSICILRECFIRFKGDFYEKALEDSISYTALYKSIKEGKQTSLKEIKVRNIISDFKEGAWAIYSKNILLMRKTKDLIGFKDIFVIVLYLAISYFSELGLVFFMYMLMIYMYASIEESNLMKEFNNYQIYLIPDKPFKKLMAVILPNTGRMTIICTITMLIAGFLFQASVVETLLYTLTIFGYICIFTSASVVSIRILKSRANRVMTSLIRMAMLLLSALPSIILGVILYFIFEDLDFVLYIVTYIPLAFNIIISFILLYLCKNMMNGRELMDD